MANRNTGSDVGEKARLRAEIDGQIADFLKRGGKINVLSSTRSHDQKRSGFGNAWHQQDDMSNLVRLPRQLTAGG